MESTCTEQEALQKALDGFIASLIRKGGDPVHLLGTAERIARAMVGYFSGLDQDPAAALRTAFDDRKYDEMILVADISLTSFCAHHFLPFVGKAHFAYIPQDRIVGLSKIPRMIGILAARPQVQEQLSAQIVDVFMDTVQPRGCGVILDCAHTCMAVRGVRKEAVTRTTALRGVFSQQHVKEEFVNSIGRVAR